MKTTKKFRLLAIVLALLLAFGAMPALAVEIDSGDYATWAQNAVEDMYERLMAAETYGAYTSIAETLSDTAYTAFLDRLTDEQRAALEERLEGLYNIATALINVVSVTKPGPLVTSYMFDSKAMRTMVLSDDIPMVLNEETTTPDGLKLSKTAADNDDGTYTIKLESYVTGTVTTETESKPVDIVLVLDVSGSMDFCIKCGKPEKGSGWTAWYTPCNCTTYVEVTDGIDGGYHNSPEYWIKNGNEYKRVYYCSSYNHRHSAGWFTSQDNHNNNTTVSPKTSSNPSGTQFYIQQSGFTSRLESLKAAVKSFVDVVAEAPASTKGEVNRIAIVTFAGSGTTKNNLTDVTTGDTGTTSLKTTIDALSADGATNSGDGMDKAKIIIDGIPSSRDSAKVVVMFTDGVPTTGNAFNSSVADKAISTSKSLKDKSVTVYTIGIFDGADPTKDIAPNPSEETDKANKYMHYVSSNYLQATGMSYVGTKNPEGDYYLATSDADELEKIFEDIAKESTSGLPSVELDSTTVVKDIVSPYFTAPAGTSDITAKIIPCASYNGTTATWDETKATTVASNNIKVDGSNVTVTGFDYANNFISENGYKEGNKDEAGDYHGAKLQISFTVSPKDGFLGGKNVPTNDQATISNGTVSYAFPEPKVDVGLGYIVVSAVDKNVYLTGSLTQDQLLENATVTLYDCKSNEVTNFAYKNAGNNYGLESWQNAFVDLSVTLPEAQENLMADSTYSLSASLNYKGETTNPAQSATQNINVFKPELTVTFADNTVDYMSVITDSTYVREGSSMSYETNKVSEATVWKHGETTDSEVTMIGNRPTLTTTYTYSLSEGVTDGKVTSTTYVPVKAEVSVKIGETSINANTTFAHENCSVTGCEWDDATMQNGNPAFLLHVINKFADLTITKVATGVDADPGQSFLFKVSGPNGYKNEVIIVGNGSVTIKDLPIGEYTVTEDMNWSWRYTPDKASQSITIKANDKNEVTITNTREKDQWLDGNTNVDNVFKSSGIVKYPAAATN